MKKINIISLLALCFVMLAVSSAMAFGEIRYPDRPLNLRKSRSAKAAWVGSLHPGQKVRVAFLKDGWVAIFEPGETRNRESAAVGFSNVKYLKKNQTRVEPKPWGELMYTPRKLNVRSRPSIRGKKVSQLAVNERVLVDFPEDDWIMVFSPNATIRSKMNAIGYSSAKYFLPAVAESSPAPVVSEVVEVASNEGQTGGAVAPPLPASKAKAEAPVKPVASNSWGKVVTIKRKVNLRKGRTSGSNYVRTLKEGEVVRVDFLKNGWYAVFAENEPVRNEKRAMGYALQSLLEGLPTSASVRSAAQGGKTATPVVASRPNEPLGGVKKTMVIDKSKFNGSKRPDPTPDKTIHGYQYKLLEKSETKKYGETWITMKVFLSTNKLLGTKQLLDFASSLWKEHKRATKNLAVLIYLPGMNTDDLAYGVVQFDDTEALEMWVRKTTLFGTDFM